MPETDISAADPFERQRVAVLDSEMAYMEAIVMPVSWEQFPEQVRAIFEGFRSEDGEGMVLEKNAFVEDLLPASILRELTEEEMAVYRALPLAGEPADVVQIVQAYGAWLQTSEAPKLLISATPGALLNGDVLEFARSWPNQREVTVEGIHFVQEDSPRAIGEAIVEWYTTI